MGEEDKSKSNDLINNIERRLIERKLSVDEMAKLYLIQNFKTNSLKPAETVEKVYKPNKKDIEEEKRILELTCLNE